jgi:hypothetical protein
MRKICSDRRKMMFSTFRSGFVNPGTAANR